MGTYAREMTTKFVKRDHSVTVFSRNPGDAPTSETWKGVEVHRPLLTDLTDLLPILMPGDVARWPLSSQEYFADVLMYNILSTSKAVNELVRKDEREFDVIVAHDWLSAIAGIAIKQTLDKPLVFHIHSTEQGRTRNGSDTIKTLERTTGKFADRIITVSNAMRGHLISLGYDAEKIRAVPNGVDHEKYDPSRELFAEEKVQQFREKIGVNGDPMIFYIGRLTWVKGVESLVQAMPIIVEEQPNAKLVILGQGEDKYSINDLIDTNGLDENVITRYEFVSEKERLMYYAACDMAVFPSRYEPFGIVCTEAMSMGNPVIVGAKGISGFREQIAPSGSKRCGSHVDPDSPKDIAKFVLELLKDEKLRNELGRNARQRVLENYTLDHVADHTLSIYERVASKE